MKWLALETSHVPGSLALWDDGRVVTEVVLDPLERTTRVMTSQMDQMFRQFDWRPGDLEGVAVCLGPGSFTGLRVGLTAAKMLAYATGCAVIGLDTLEVMANQLPETWQSAWIVVDAQRQEWHGARYERVGPLAWRRRGPIERIAWSTWLARPNTESGEMVLRGVDIDGACVGWSSLSDEHGTVRISGSGLSVLESWVASRAAQRGLAAQASIWPAAWHVAPSDHWIPRAATLVECAVAAYGRGIRHDPWTLAAEYHRASAAEEKRAARPVQ